MHSDFIRSVFDLGVGLGGPASIAYHVAVLTALQTIAVLVGLGIYLKAAIGFNRFFRGLAAAVVVLAACNLGLVCLQVLPLSLLFKYLVFGTCLSMSILIELQIMRPAKQLPENRHLIAL